MASFALNFIATITALFGLRHNVNTIVLECDSLVHRERGGPLNCLVGAQKNNCAMQHFFIDEAVLTALFR